MTGTNVTVLPQQRTPPHNYEAEMALLGAIMANNEVYDRCSGFLKADHFADALHGRIYEAIGRLRRQHKVANPVTLKNLFDLDDALAEIGGAKYLVQLAGAVVSVLNAEDYAVAIRDLFVRRQLMGIAEELFHDISHVDPADSVLEIIQGYSKRLDFVATQPGLVPTDALIRPISEVMDSVLQRAERAYQGKTMLGISTGLDALDTILNGLCEGDLCVLAGRPGMGKTALALSITTAIAKMGKRVGFESIEMTDEQLGLRALSGPSGVNSAQVRAGRITQADLEALLTAAHDLRGLPIAFAASSAPFVEDVTARWLAHKRRNGLDVLIIDYLQLMKTFQRTNGRVEEVSAVSAGAKAMAKKLGIPVIALCQLSRGVEGRDNKRPILSDLRESGSIEQDGDQVCFIYRHEYYLSQQEPEQKPGEDLTKFNDRKDTWSKALAACHGEAEVIVAKNRHGRVGTARIAFDANRQEFANQTTSGPAGAPPPADPNDKWEERRDLQ